MVRLTPAVEAVMTEVPAAEITLIARILARVSIPPPHPSYP
jgi:hypothetical protein